MINTYVIESGRTTTKEIIESDAALVLPFLESRLDPEKYSHCVVAQEFLSLLERRHISFDFSLRERFSSCNCKEDPTPYGLYRDQAQSCNSGA